MIDIYVANTELSLVQNLFVGFNILSLFVILKINSYSGCFFNYLLNYQRSLIMIKSYLLKKAVFTILLYYLRFIETFKSYLKHACIIRAIENTILVLLNFRY